MIQIRLSPQGKSLRVPTGTPLQSILFEQGIEFPCGGKGLCRGCRIRVLEGNAPITQKERNKLSADELSQSWRLACQIQANDDLDIHLPQLYTSILADESQFNFTPSEGLGIAVDVGTTTIAAQLIDLGTGQVLATASDLNPQGQYGADLISRVQYAVDPQGLKTLRNLIRTYIGSLLNTLLKQSDKHKPINRVVLVGNSVMHHLFAGIDLTPLSSYPFEVADGSIKTFHIEELGWSLTDGPEIVFLPCLGGYVGSDILAGILATGMHISSAPRALIDLGTNGEIVVGNREGMIVASTAAGPAFEGGNIRMGMRACTGAIFAAQTDGEQILCRVIGETSASGICGSGLVDAIAAALQLGWIDSSGRIQNERKEIVLVDEVVIIQRDIRQLQLAKAAIAAGLKILLEHLQLTISDLESIHLAGAFGNCIHPDSAGIIGLLPTLSVPIQPVGNTALRGAKMALFEENPFPTIECIREKTSHISLSSHPAFQDEYVNHMALQRTE